MNQDQLKEILNKYTEDKDFTITFSGKKSKIANGLYEPNDKGIIIHNKNFKNDNEMMYTALHELAHHIDYTKNRNKTKRNAHGGEFPIILSAITEDAIVNEDFIPLKKEELSEIIEGNKEFSKAMKKFGYLLSKIRLYCEEKGYPFSDIIERVLHMKRGEVSSLENMNFYDISENVGADFGRRISKIKDEGKRAIAEKLGNIPPSTSYSNLDEYALLQQEKARIEKTIDKLSRRLEEVDLQLEGSINH